jgi:hypothetical protein
MKMLNKEDLYEIEKALDIYGGIINDTLNKYCQTAVHCDAVRKGKEINPMQEVVKDLLNSRTRIKLIRNKLESMRKKNG